MYYGRPLLLDFGIPESLSSIHPSKKNSAHD
jgi:hypothetical protein